MGQDRYQKLLTALNKSRRSVFGFCRLEPLLHLPRSATGAATFTFAFRTHLHQYAPCFFLPFAGFLVFLAFAILSSLSNDILTNKREIKVFCFLLRFNITPLSGLTLWHNGLLNVVGWSLLISENRVVHFAACARCHTTPTPISFLLKSASTYLACASKRPTGLPSALKAKA